MCQALQVYHRLIAEVPRTELFWKLPGAQLNLVACHNVSFHGYLLIFVHWPLSAFDGDQRRRAEVDETITDGSVPMILIHP